MGPVAQLFAWLHVPPALAGFVATMSNLGRSRWAALLAGAQYRQLFGSSFSK